MKDFLKKVYVAIRKYLIQERRKRLVREAWERHHHRMTHVFLFEEDNEVIDYAWKSSIALFDTEYKEIHERLVPYNEKFEGRQNDKC